MKRVLAFCTAATLGGAHVISGCLSVDSFYDTKVPPVVTLASTGDTPATDAVVAGNDLFVATDNVLTAIPKGGGDERRTFRLTRPIVALKADEKGNVAYCSENQLGILAAGANAPRVVDVGGCDALAIGGGNVMVSFADGDDGGASVKDPGKIHTTQLAITGGDAVPGLIPLLSNEFPHRIALDDAGTLYVSGAKADFSALFRRCKSSEENCRDGDNPAESASGSKGGWCLLSGHVGGTIKALRITQGSKGGRALVGTTRATYTVDTQACCPYVSTKGTGVQAIAPSLDACLPNPARFPGDYSVAPLGTDLLLLLSTGTLARGPSDAPSRANKSPFTELGADLHSLSTDGVFAYYLERNRVQRIEVPPP